MTDKNRKNTTITIRLTETEKNAIVCRANRRRKSITRFVIESTADEDRPMRNVREILVKIKKLTDSIRQMDRSIRDKEITDLNMENILDMQKDIYSLLIKLAANGGH